MPTPRATQSRLSLLRQQRNAVDRLREDLAQSKARQKAAALRLDRALADLEVLIGRDDESPDLFPVAGVVKLDPKTGCVDDYVGIDDPDKDQTE